MDDDFDDRDDLGDEDDEQVPVPLDRREAARVRRDLDDLGAFRNTFEPEGYKGVSLFCQDCLEDHFYGWDMLAHNLQALLESGEIPMHEPAYDPRPDEYIDWEYAQGYLDGLSDGGSPLLPAQEGATGGCPFCAAPLPDQDGQDGEHGAVYCPTCGAHLGPARIARALLDKGWSAEDVNDLLRGARIPPVSGLATRSDSSSTD